MTGQTPATVPEVLNIAATGYGLKFFLSASMTPFLYLLKVVLTEKFGLKPIPAEVDEPTAVTPLTLASEEDNSEIDI